MSGELLRALLGQRDGGAPSAPPPPAKAEDEELLRELELLQNLDGASDLELLEALSTDS